LKKSAIIVAGGTGTRMNTAVPKQFLPVAGKPMVMHSLQAFMDAVPGISLVLALPRNHFDTWRKLCREYAFTAPHELTPGGETRFHSVRNALAITGDGLVAVHDGARPLLSGALILRTFMEAERFGNCIPVIPVNESVRKIKGGLNRPVERDTLRIVQTPQVFDSVLLRKAYQQDWQENFTDDATVVESMGGTIHLTEGDPANIKITYRQDVAIAELLFEKLHA